MDKLEKIEVPKPLKHSERVKPIIADILKAVRAKEYDMVDCWLAYRLLALQFENALVEDLDYTIMTIVKEAREKGR